MVSAAAGTIGLGAAAVLGLVEGLTEFVPVSSTGHLVLARHALGLGEGGLAFDAALQAATALAILCYFWRDVWALVRAVPSALRVGPAATPEASTLRAIVVSAIPIVAFGLLLDKFIEAHGRGELVVVAGLLAGAALLWWGDRKLCGQTAESAPLSLGRAGAVGLFQALALWPGVSRSGAMISGGALLGLSREAAARFTFVAGLPVLLGAGAKKLLDLWKTGELGSQGAPLLLACVVGFASGYAAIGVLMRYLRQGSLRPFVWYRVALAVVVLVVTLS